MPAGQIQNHPIEGPDDFDDQDDNAGVRVEHPAFLAFHQNELAEEEFVNLTEGIAPDLPQTAHESQQFHQYRGRAAFRDGAAARD